MKKPNILKDTLYNRDWVIAWISIILMLVFGGKLLNLIPDRIWGLLLTGIILGIGLAIGVFIVIYFVFKRDDY